MEIWFELYFCKQRYASLILGENHMLFEFTIFSKRLDHAKTFYLSTQVSWATYFNKELRTAHIKGTANDVFEFFKYLIPVF